MFDVVAFFLHFLVFSPVSTRTALTRGLQVVKNGDVWNGNQGAEVVEGLSGAHGLDVNEHLVVVAGSLDDGVVLFARDEHTGTVSFLDRWRVGQRSIPSFHALNSVPLASSSPRLVTWDKSIHSARVAMPPPPPAPASGSEIQTSFVLLDGQGPVVLKRSHTVLSATDAVSMSINGQNYVVLAEASHMDTSGAGGVSVFTLQHQQVQVTRKILAESNQEQSLIKSLINATHHPGLIHVAFIASYKTVYKLCWKLCLLLCRQLYLLVSNDTGGVDLSRKAAAVARC